MLIQFEREREREMVIQFESDEQQWRGSQECRQVQQGIRNAELTLFWHYLFQTSVCYLFSPFLYQICACPFLRFLRTSFLFLNLMQSTPSHIQLYIHIYTHSEKMGNVRHITTAAPDNLADCYLFLSFLRHVTHNPPLFNFLLTLLPFIYFTPALRDLWFLYLNLFFTNS